MTTTSKKLNNLCFHQEQLLLFADPLPTVGQLLEDLISTKQELDNVRRGLFSRISEMKKEIASLKEQLELVRTENRLKDHRRREREARIARAEANYKPPKPKTPLCLMIDDMVNSKKWVHI